MNPRPVVHTTAELEAALADAPALLQLHLEGPEVDAGMVSRLAGDAGLTALKTVSFIHTGCCDLWLETLARSPLAARLVLLCFRRCGLTAAGLRALGARPWPMLHTLTFNSDPSGPGLPNQLDDAALAALASPAAPWPSLASLDVSWYPVTRAGIEALLSPNLPALREVTAWRTALTEDDANHFARQNKVRVVTDFDPRIIDYSGEG